jgi:hypothetical protein
MDWRVQRWLRLCEQAVTTHTQLNNNILKFEYLLQQVLNGIYQMNLPASFKKVENSTKPAADKEFKQANAGYEGERKGGNKKKRKSENGNRNIKKIRTRQIFCSRSGQIMERYFQQTISARQTNLG